MDEDKKVEILDPATISDLTKQIAEAGDDTGKITSLLMQVTEAYTNLFATHASVTDNYNKAVEEQAKLKQYNFDLMMQYGAKITGNQASSGSPAAQRTEERTRAETITIDDLFKEEKKDG